MPTDRDLLLTAPLAAILLVAGIGHFTHDDDFASIVPAALPAPYAIVYLSGLIELALGAGLLSARTRRPAALLSIALFVAVFPANVNMAIHEIPAFGAPTDPVLLYGRLPLQLVLIGWAWWIARRASAPRT